MKILIINELYNLGGAEVFALGEKELLETENEVLYLTLDSNYSNEWKADKNHLNYKPAYKTCFKKLYHIIPRKYIVEDLKKIIESFSPDYIHLNCLDDYALEVYSAVRGYEVFQTIHDHYAVCPKGVCIYSDLSPCSGYSFSKCFKNCFLCASKASFLREFVKWYFKRVYCLHSVKNFICPSRFLSKKCIEQKMNVKCINNPFDTFLLPKSIGVKNVSKKSYLFYGVISERKGIIPLLAAFVSFAENKDVELLIAGKFINGMEDTIKPYLDIEKIKYLGIFSHEEMMNQLAQADVVVVPSVGMDNYPYVVLEAICAKCLVIASDRGGMAEIINDERLIFDVSSKADIIQKLEYTFSMSNEEKKKIIEKSYDYVCKNNHPKIYLKNLYEFIQSMK